MEKRNLVQVQYRGRRSGKFEGDAYTYIADVPLEVGDIVNVPTKYGESEAQVCRINVPEGDIPAWCGSLRHITEAAVPQDMFAEFFDQEVCTGGNPDF